MSATHAAGMLVTTPIDGVQPVSLARQRAPSPYGLPELSDDAFKRGFGRFPVGAHVGS